MGDANAWSQLLCPFRAAVHVRIGERGYILVSHRNWKTSRHPMPSVGLTVLPTVASPLLTEAEWWCWYGLTVEVL